jgi:hypothetical protein
VIAPERGTSAPQTVLPRISGWISPANIGLIAIHRDDVDIELCQHSFGFGSFDAAIRQQASTSW